MRRFQFVVPVALLALSACTNMSWYKDRAQTPGDERWAPVTDDKPQAPPRQATAKWTVAGTDAAAMTEKPAARVETPEPIAEAHTFHETTRTPPPAEPATEVVTIAEPMQPQASATSATQEWSRSEPVQATTSPETVSQPSFASFRPTPTVVGMSRAMMAFPTGDPNTSAIVLEKIAPSEVALGQPYEYELVVTNLTSATLENVVVEDRMPGQFSFDKAEPMPASLDRLSWTLGSLRPHEATTIRVAGRASRAGPVTSCSEVTYASSTCLTTEVVEPALLLVAEAPPEALICETVLVRYTISNPGSGTARGVVVQGTLPEGLLTPDGHSDFSQRVGDLSAGQSRTFAVEVRPQGTGLVQHEAVATAEGNLMAATAAVTTLIQKPQLTIEHQGSARVFIGGKAKYQITVTNVGDAIARDVTLIESPSQGTRFHSATGDGVAAGSDVRWQLGDLPPQMSHTVEVVFEAQEIGMSRALATVEAVCAEPVSASVDTDLRGIPAILLEVVDVEDPVPMGDVTTYVIKVTNQGSAPGSNIRISCVLPPGLSYVSSTGVTQASAGGSNVDFSALARLEPGQEVMWRVTTRAELEGDVRFKVSMISDQLTGPVEETEATYLYQ